MDFDYSKPNRIINGVPTYLTDDEIAEQAVAASAWTAGAVQRSLARIETAIQGALDAQARARGYDDLRSAISYRGSTNPTWAHEADVFFAWRDAAWAKALSVLADVQAGKAQVPTPEEAMAMIPPLVF